MAVASYADAIHPSIHPSIQRPTLPIRPAMNAMLTMMAVPRYAAIMKEDATRNGIAPVTHHAEIRAAFTIA